MRQYLSRARLRFQEENEKKMKNKIDSMVANGSSDNCKKNTTTTTTTTTTDGGGSGGGSSSNTDPDRPSECINPECSMYGTSATAYMCNSCYRKQKTQEMEHIRRNNSSGVSNTFSTDDDLQSKPNPVSTARSSFHAPLPSAVSSAAATGEASAPGGGDLTSDGTTSNIANLRVPQPQCSDANRDEAIVIIDKGRTVSDPGCVPSFIDLDADCNAGDTGGPVDLSRVGSMKVGGPQYGAGKSRFYAQLDTDSRSVSSIPTARSLSSRQDDTIFLSNSTFYKDGRNYRKNGNDNRQILRNSTNNCSSLRPQGSNSKVSVATERNSSKTIDGSNSIGDANNSNSNNNSNSIDKYNNRQDTGYKQALNLKDNTTNNVTNSSGSGSGSGSCSPPTQDNNKRDPNQHQCLMELCEFYGSALYGGYCSKCASARALPSSVATKKKKSNRLK